VSADLSSADLSDGDLARLARGGDPAAFRLLVERHQAMVRARARQLGPGPGDVDDIVQESFLQAFLALDRLRDPDRFAGWLAGIVLNVCRGLHRRAPVTLLADWPEPLHPTSAGGLPSPEDLDRADALRTAVAGLPAGQRRAVALHYYADVPASQVAEAPGAARASLHKARLRLRAYLTEHRPDLVPGRTYMTTVRVARIERRIPPGPVPDRFPTHVMVLADDSGRRDLPIWLLGRDSHRFADDARSGPSSDELTDRLLHAAGTRVTAVDVDELGPEVTVARIELATPGGPEQVTARLLDGLAVAITSGAPIRVADAVMDRMAVPAGAGLAGAGLAGTGQGGPMPERTARDLRLDQRPRYEPRNLTFAAGLDHWVLGGSFTENALQSHWDDYQAAADHGTAALSAAVPQPEGFAWLAPGDLRRRLPRRHGHLPRPTPYAAGREPRRAVPADHEAAGPPRAVHRAGCPGRPEESHRHHRRPRGVVRPRGHRAGPRRHEHGRVRRLPGRPRPDRAAHPPADH
jgi:RNA polymerase sigma factor (sigma-70 family)